ncbi:MAG: sigma 54-interacting transcriptional regulator, partial [Eubacterium sp.]|nr:sigma 54-interacting transcriptional regulator [Eubacterium sp.]
MECLDTIGGPDLFDLSVNCAEIQGAETINILATKSGGTVIFANLINNYNIALYITEAISKQLDIRCADGYLEAYDEFDFEIIRDMMPYFDEEEVTAVKSKTEGDQHKRQVTRSGLDRTMMEGFVCESHAMSVVLDEILTVSRYDCNVLVTGETGTGKEKVANIIHKNSNRNMQPFIKVNCAAL